MPETWINLNGELLPADQVPLSMENRAFKYGDGFFETVRLMNGALPLWEHHVTRMEKAIEFLGLELAGVSALADELKALAGKNGLPNARIRLTIYRSGAGTYQPEGSKAAYLIEASPLESSCYELNEKGLTIGLFSDEKKYPGVLSGIKTNSALLYIQASRCARQQGWDDALILNTKDQIIEATASNLFLVKGTNLHTPPLKHGPVDGIMRKVILQQAMEAGFQVSAGPISKDTLLQADEVWLTNAIRGIRWVGQFEGKTYTNRQAERMVGKLSVG